MAHVEETPRKPARPPQWFRRGLEEIGLLSVHRAPWDTKILMLQRFIRLFAYGGSTLILAAYLNEIGISETRTGLFMTLTLVGDVFISFCLTCVADAWGRRAILALGAGLMAASGLVFALSDNYWVLLAAAILGVITPSGNEIGPFRAVEESVIAHLTDKHDRPSTFAWYALTGQSGSAIGLTVDAGRDLPLMFVIYAAVGLIKLALTLILSQDCEAEKPEHTRPTSETAPLLGGGRPESHGKQPSKFAMLPRLSRESRAILVQLCALFALDNFASGLAPMSWVTFYFKRRFDLAEGAIGTLFFITSIISALSILVAASIARRIGNVKTMVFTHLPSAVSLAMIGIPNQLPLAMLFVLLRACTQSMDTAPRSAFLAAIVLPNERTVTMGTVNVVKTISQSLGPFITGILVERSLFWVAFLTAGILKATYDIGMLVLFASHKSREDREADDDNDGQHAA
ncbi:MFS general substrate transporter [Teratosphaeria destructans]|uniref:MFS general substrate transporter n=1 Tax=Teratosphaeria destructans TaxID=418781 RepID=A0A9W7SUL5_9PEZI|nr:MFS general substrate transporter [Teratosphaeria destructans]